MKKLLLSILLAIPMIAFAQTNLSQGGTGHNSSTAGDLLVGTSSTIRYSRLPIGTAGKVLQSSSTSPFKMEWVGTSTLGISGSGSVCGSIGSFGLVQFASSTAGCFDSDSVFNWSTTSARLSFTNGSSSNLSATGATFTNLFVPTKATIGNASTTAVSGNGFFPSMFSTNASTTNLSATGAFLASLFSTNASTTNLSAGGLSATNAFISNASTTNLSATGATFTNTFTGNASTTNVSGNLFSTNAFISSLTNTTGVFTNSTTTLAAFTRSTTTIAFISNASTTNLSSSGFFSTNSFVTNASTTNLSATGLSVTSAFASKFDTVNASTTNLTLSSALFDSVNSRGSNGNCLLATGTSTLWGACSSGTFVDLTTNQTIAGNKTFTGTTTLATTTMSVGSSTIAFSAPTLFTSGTAYLTNASTTNLSATGAFLASLFSTNASTTNLSAGGFSGTNAFITTASTTAFSAGTMTSGNAFFTGTTLHNGLATFGMASTTGISGNGTFGNTWNTGTLLVTGQTTLGNASTTAFSGNGFSANFFSTNASTTNLSATGFTGTNELITGTATIVNASTTKLSATTGATLSDSLFTGLFDLTSNRFRVNAQGGISVATSAVPFYGLEVATTTKFLAGTVQRVSGYTSSSSITVNLNNTDIATTTVNQTTTFQNPTGTAFDGGMFEIRALATTTQTLAWGTAFASSTDLAYPTSIASGTTRILWEYSQDRAKWDLVGLLKTYDR